MEWEGMVKRIACRSDEIDAILYEPQTSQEHKNVVILTKEELDEIRNGKWLYINVDGERVFVRLGKLEERAQTHELKLRDRFADAVLKGKKKFEIRYDDRGYQVGDFIKFDVVDSSGRAHVEHALNNVLFKIIYVLKTTEFGLNEGYVGLGIERVWHTGGEAI